MVVGGATDGAAATDVVVAAEVVVDSSDVTAFGVADEHAVRSPAAAMVASRSTG
jgi:nucleoside phosphorylase